jgi:hypothetical protein
LAESLPHRALPVAPLGVFEGHAWQMAGTNGSTRHEVIFRALSPLLAMGVPHGRNAQPHELHVDRDVVCPRCLQWIEPTDFVRLTRYGLHQHEACG